MNMNERARTFGFSAQTRSFLGRFPNLQPIWALFGLREDGVPESGESAVVFAVTKASWRDGIPPV